MVRASRVGVIPLPLLFVLLAGSSAGCGGGGGGSPSLAEFMDRFVAASCEYEVACGYMPDVATCVAALDELPFATLEPEIASGKIRYDAAKAGVCLAYMERIFGPTPCKLSALYAASDRTGSEACTEILAGTVAAGGACRSSVECAGGGSCPQTDPACSGSLQCCPGTCVARPEPTPVGGDCSTTFTCVTGAVCYALAASPFLFTCVMPSTSTVEGAPCDAAALCVPPLVCDAAPPSSTGTCQLAAASGAPCNSSLTLACDDLHDYCSLTTSTCTPRAAVGESCDPAQANCIGYAECVGTSCVARLPAGAACRPTGGPACLGNLRCAAQTNTCALAPVPPDTCI